MFVVERVDRAPLGHMTFPRFRPLLARTDDPGIIRIVARGPGGDVAGLLLAETNGRVATMLSLFVTPAARRQGVGTAMLGELAGTAARAGMAALAAVWTTRSPGTPAFEATLAAAGWSAPQLRMTFFEGAPQPMSEARWFRATPAPQAPYAVTPWSTVTADELGAIRRGDPAPPSDLSPFFREEHIERQVSRVLRRDGRIVGWSLVHDLPERPDALVFSRSWSHPEHRAGARGLATIVAAVQAQVDLRADRRLSIFEVPAGNEHMQRVYRKRIEPFGRLTYESRTSGLPLRPA